MIAPFAVLSLLLPLLFLAGVVGLVVWTQRRRRAQRSQRAAEVASVGWYPVPPSPWRLEWQIAGNAFVSWSVGGFAVPDVFARLDAMTRLIDLIPPFVLRDYGQPTY